MAYWLLKTEPDCYGWDDLLRDRKTSWDGVTNALALKHIRSMKKGDLALIYHTANQRSIVGIAQIASDPYPDAKSNDQRIVTIDVVPKSALNRPVTLDQIKADPAFAGWDLLRLGRQSVVPVPAAIWKRIEKLAGEKSSSA